MDSLCTHASCQGGVSARYGQPSHLQDPFAIPYCKCFIQLSGPAYAYQCHQACQLSEAPQGGHRKIKYTLCHNLTEINVASYSNHQFNHFTEIKLFWHLCKYEIWVRDLPDEPCGKCQEYLYSLLTEVMECGGSAVC